MTSRTKKLAEKASVKNADEHGNEDVSLPQSVLVTPLSTPSTGKGRGRRTLYGSGGLECGGTVERTVV